MIEMEGMFQTPIQSNPSNFFVGVTILKESDDASKDFAGAMTIWHQSSRSGSNEPDRRSHNRSAVVTSWPNEHWTSKEDSVQLLAGPGSSDLFPWLPFTETCVRMDQEGTSITREAREILLLADIPEEGEAETAPPKWSKTDHPSGRQTATEEAMIGTKPARHVVSIPQRVMTIIRHTFLRQQEHNE